MRLRTINPVTVTGEENRHLESVITGSPGDQESVRQVYGTIATLDVDGRPLITVYSDDNSPVANGGLIPLNHSPSEIVEKWGTIRQGMRVLVSFVGIDGSQANATIINEIGEKNEESPLEENTAVRGLFAIFTPGIIG